MNPFIISFLKILIALLGLIIAAGLKWSKEQFKHRSIRGAIVEHTARYPHQDRLLYKEGVDKFMEKNHPQTVNFVAELWANAFRPMYILIMVLLIFYHNVLPYVIFVVAVALCAVFAEINFDGWKDKKWFKISLVALWLLTYALITYSEFQTKPIVVENTRKEQLSPNYSLSGDNK